jgi:hypothetical protein
MSDTPIGPLRDFSTRTTAGAKGPLGEVDRRPRPLPFNAGDPDRRPRPVARLAFLATGA